AAWLLGLLVGLANSALALLLLAVQPLAVGIPGTELASTVISYLVLTVVTDAILCAFASWYRRFLRQSQERSRAAREARAREQRRQNRPGRQPAR
ncbi:MAG TPA: hypothetical protein VFK38_03040, partial [Candidatus Limnocylindrales bacterium]|nr:hypothetical protein [Candidatus Limnocylindrales bacterium]